MLNHYISKQFQNTSKLFATAWETDKERWSSTYKYRGCSLHCGDVLQQLLRVSSIESWVITDARPFSSKKQLTAAERACEITYTAHISFFIPAQVDICCNARETPSVCFQNETMYLKNRRKDSFLVQRVRVPRKINRRMLSSGIFFLQKLSHICLPLRSGRHIFTGRLHARAEWTATWRAHGVSLRRSVFLYSSINKTLKHYR